MFAHLKHFNVWQWVLQFINIIKVAACAIMVWRAISFIANTTSPMVVVLSGSMEPAFHRGDILFLTLPRNEAVKANDICVFKLSESSIPIVHRVIKIHTNADTQKEYILTKGDNNQSDDRDLYIKDQMWINREHIVGKVKGIVPYVGLITIMMSDYPWIKFILIGTLVLSVIMHRE